MLKAATGAVQRWLVTGNLSDPGAVLYATWISVWGRWFIWLVGVFQLVYRPEFWYPEDIEYLAVSILLFTVNGLVHYQLRTNRPVTWRWLLFLCTIDVSLITASIIIHIGFDSFIFVAYYPALALFAVVFTSFWPALAWTTLTAVACALVCFTVDSGFDIGAGHEKALVARLAAMYALVLGLSLIIRFERIRWQTAVEGERQLLQERIELSQTTMPNGAGASAG